MKKFAIAIFGLSALSAAFISTPSRAYHQDIATIFQSGVASFYAKKFHGRQTANGEIFDNHAMTAAHKSLEFGTIVRVTNRRNGREVVVRINDRGPWAKGRVIDLSLAAAREIGMIRHGTARVDIEILN